MSSTSVTIRIGTEFGSHTLAFPATYEVCPRCEGRGKHSNPAVDGHGISAEEFEEDPGFRDDYMSGVYDVTCPRRSSRQA